MSDPPRNWQKPLLKPSATDSPCVRNCCLDEHDVCLGCGRELQEILRWQSASNEDREAIRAAAKHRLARLRERRQW